MARRLDGELTGMGMALTEFRRRWRTSWNGDEPDGDSVRFAYESRRRARQQPFFMAVDLAAGVHE